MITPLSPYRLRILFRGAFLLLAVATVYMALYVLREEKQQSLDNYKESFHKTRDQIAARLRHPTGQLALLNPYSGTHPVTPLRPLLLPYSSLDFDDQTKVRHAIEMAGCMVQYPDDAAVCVAVGSNPWAGAFIYAAGRFKSEALVPHPVGERYLDDAHRLRLQVDLRGHHYSWLAPFQTPTPNQPFSGRLTGFVENASGDYVSTRPVKDFRGWIWQNRACAPTEGAPTSSACLRESFFSVRLPVEVLREAMLEEAKPVWPPTDLDAIQVRIEVLPPHSETPIFDSNVGEAHPPFLLSELAPLLLPGESLRIHKRGDPANVHVIQMSGAEAPVDESWKAIYWLIRKLPVDTPAAVSETREAIATPLGTYDLILNGDVRSANKILARAATRVSWFVAAMLLAIFVAWFVIEVGVIRRIARLTRRAASVSRTVKGGPEHGLPDLSDLRGHDEMGILASCLHDLLRRVREDVEREKIRAEQEKDMWHAVGHEIMSPLQSLMALHGNDPADPSSRYIHRMQQAIRVLYGSASPSEAFQTTRLQLQAIDLNAFLRDVAANAPCAGIDSVHYQPGNTPVMVRADEYSLEDVVTHVLRNADRHRLPGTPITLTLECTPAAALITLHNQGPHIANEMMGKIFEYGVSDQVDSGANGSRGQGLFVAKTYMAKMGGTIVAQNVPDGVQFALSLLRATNN